MELQSSICHHIKSGAKCFIMNLDPITVKPAFYTDDIGNGEGVSVICNSEIDFKNKFK
jgi:hypothetical protein